MCRDTLVYTAAASNYPSTACPLTITPLTSGIKYQHYQQLAQPLSQAASGDTCAGQPVL